MAEGERVPALEPAPSVVAVTHVIYGLHALSLVTGIVTAATIVFTFLMGWPSIIAVILNYVKRREARGTWLESHFRWQIRTFWFAVLWFVIAWLLIVTILGAVIGIPILIVVTLWLIYRIGRGWLRLRDKRPMYV